MAEKTFLAQKIIFFAPKNIWPKKSLAESWIDRKKYFYFLQQNFFSDFAKNNPPKISEILYKHAIKIAIQILTKYPSTFIKNFNRFIFSFFEKNVKLAV